MNNKYSKCYKASLKVVNLYDILNDILIDNNAKIDEFYMIVNEIDKAILEEDNLYNELSLEEIDEFISIIKIIETARDYTMVDARVSSRIAYVSDILCGYSIKNNGLVSSIDDDFEIGIYDLMYTKIAIDLYKLISFKIDSLNLNDKESLRLAREIKNEDIQQFIYKISLRVLGEKYAINKYFDINKLDNIDLSIVEDRLLNEKDMDIDLFDMINKDCYNQIIEIINILSKLSINYNSHINIYDNLVYVSQIEVLIHYLNKEQLKDILDRCNNIKSSNRLVLGNVKNIVKKKIKEER